MSTPVCPLECLALRERAWCRRHAYGNLRQRHDGGTLPSQLRPQSHQFQKALGRADLECRLPSHAVEPPRSISGPEGRGHHEPVNRVEMRCDVPRMTWRRRSVPIWSQRARDGSQAIPDNPQLKTRLRTTILRNSQASSSSHRVRAMTNAAAVPADPRAPRIQIP